MKYIFGYSTNNGGGRNTVEANTRKEAEKKMRKYIEGIRPGYRYEMWLEVQLTENANG
jgi:hypothetical protein